MTKKKNYFGIFFLASVFSMAASAVEPNLVEYLQFRNESQRERDDIFAGRLKEGDARLALARAEYVLKRAEVLEPQGTISRSEYLDATIDVMKAHFDIKRGENHILVATIKAQIADLRAKWALSGKPEPKRQAELNIDLRKARIQILKKLANSLVPFVKALKEKFERGNGLLPRGAIATDEVNALRIAKEGALGLVHLAASELRFARTELEEAQREFWYVSAQKEALQ